MPLPENDTVRTIGAEGHRVWLYPTRIVGRFVRARTLFAWALCLVLLIAPWVDVGGHPALRFDIPDRRFYLFGLTLFATDASWLLFVFGFIVVGIFLTTSLLGRAWCGWACPQTVFLETLIRPLEQLIEGKPSERRKLDAAPWSVHKVVKKATKLGAYLIVAGMAATTFLALFMGREDVIEAQGDPLSHPIGTGFFLAMTGLLLFDFAWFREQTCVVVCPYGRFQSVLLDPDSLTVGYDAKRGEPRGHKSAPGAGDCVDCRKCVQVCPTGIDIRQGSQMECVACAACIDACDGVMEKIGRPRGLIRYASENALAGRPARRVRPRVVIYGTVFAGLVVALLIGLERRQPVELALTRQVGAPWSEMADGRFENRVRLRIANKQADVRRFTVSVPSPAGVQVITPLSPAEVAPGQVVQVPLFLLAPDPKAPNGQSQLRVEVRDDHGFTQTLPWTFLSRPAPGGDT